MSYIMGVSGSTAINNNRAYVRTGAMKGSLSIGRSSLSVNPLPTDLSQISGSYIDNRFDNVGYYVGQSGAGY